MLSQHIVAICGPAGSLEGLKKIFNHIPLNNATYIILRHLPADYRSSLDTVLERHPESEVLEAQQGAAVLSNKAYYAPPRYHLVIKDGTFELIRRTAGAYNNAIDLFLQSLARNENREKAIAVILSGTGNDGLRGAVAIKKEGGLVIVQAPESCVFLQLPQHLIDRGYADFVLLPEDMPPVIQGHVNRRALSNTIDE